MMKKKNYINIFVYASILATALYACKTLDQNSEVKESNINKPLNISKLKNAIYTDKQSNIFFLWDHNIDLSWQNKGVTTTSNSVILINSKKDEEGKAQIKSLNFQGKENWQLNLDETITNYSIGEEFIAIATDDEELKLINVKSGKEVWSIDESGRPYIFEDKKTIILSDEESVNSELKVLDLDGNKVKSEKEIKEIISTKFNVNGNKIITALTGGEIKIRNLNDLAILSSKKVEGEIVDISSTNSSNEVAVLVNSKQKQIAYLLNSKLEIIWSKSFEHIGEQISLTDNSVIIYGNTAKGQNLELFSHNGEVVTSLKDKVFSEFTSQVRRNNFQEISIALEFSEEIQKSHLLLFNNSNKLLWNIPAPQSESIIYYSIYKIKNDESFVTISSENNHIYFYKIN